MVDAMSASRTGGPDMHRAPPGEKPESTPARTLVQATCVLVGARGVLVRGVPGSGKSSLTAALAAADGPARLVRLVADDAVHVGASSGRLVAVAPEPTRGTIEMRGVGIVPVAFESRAVIRLVVDLVAAESVERMPDPDRSRVTLCGVALPRIRLAANDLASANRVFAALAALSTEANNGIASAFIAVHKGRIRA